MGFLLFLVASILWFPLNIINFFCVMFSDINKHGFFKYKSRYFLGMAVDIDRFGNRNFRTLWNIILIKNNGYSFGDDRETISSALGKNQEKNTLSKFGVFLCKILDSIDPNHCVKSIKNLDHE